jgi:hypothetical protein
MISLGKEIVQDKTDTFDNAGYGNYSNAQSANHTSLVETTTTKNAMGQKCRNRLQDVQADHRPINCATAHCYHHYSMPQAHPDFYRRYCLYILNQLSAIRVSTESRAIPQVSFDQGAWHTNFLLS